MEVLVVGGGLGGLAAGLAAHRAGHDVTVLERAPQLRDSGAGIGLPPNGVLALEALGLGTQVREQAPDLEQGGGLHDRHGRPLLAADQAAMRARTGASLIAVHRTWLHTLLARTLPAGTVHTGQAVTDVRNSREHVEVDVRGGGTLRADAVVVADGADSRLRRKLFLAHPGLVGSGEQAARAIAPSVPPGLPLVVGELLDHRTGDRFGCLPLADGSAFWYATWRASAPTDPAERLAWLTRRRADWHASAPVLIAATPPEEVHVVETSRLAQPLPRLAVGRVALLGDAAHAMTPDLGQGACQAFEDAVALGAVLEGAGAEEAPTALQRYDAIRHARTTALQRDSRRMNSLLRITGPRGRLRDAALRAIPRALTTRALAAQFRFDPLAR